MQTSVADATSQLPSQKLEVEKLYAAISTLQNRGDFANGQQFVELLTKVSEMLAFVVEATSQLPSQKLDVEKPLAASSTKSRRSKRSM